MLKVVLVLLICAGAWAVVILADLRYGPEAFREAYRQAQRDDVEYARTHPGCSLEEAHQHREAVKRRFRRK